LKKLASDTFLRRVKGEKTSEKLFTGYGLQEVGYDRYCCENKVNININVAAFYSFNQMYNFRIFNNVMVNKD